ncbi:MAG: tRNA (adenosine(37)-N6)-threonylcarbamoyltransferase complex dimerization subunit type 1 TsaB [Gemmatimonadaceae bacterium]
MATCTLALDASTYAGSVALLRDSVVVAERTLADTGMPPKGGREERMLPLVAECLEESGVRAGELGRVVCGAGPGSFTSLRIAASVAKGLAAGIGCPLFSVSSLLLTVAGLESLPSSGLHLSVLPAMRDEWFVAEISVDAADITKQVSPVSIVTALHLREAEEAGASIVGPGQACDARPHARGVARLLAAIVARGAENLDGWEPDYGRLAEAQVKWEAAHGRSLFAG